MGYANNIEGWMHPRELEFLHEEASKVKTVLEIGTYCGKSAHAYLTAGVQKLTCVDWWRKGDVIPNDESGEDIYQKFVRNTAGFPDTELVAIRASSEEAKAIIGDEKFDMIFIDASHDYESVKKDLELWMGNATVLICGHDYGWPGVHGAVDEVMKVDGVCESIWYKRL